MADSKARSQARYTQFAAGYVTSQTHATGDDLERLIALAQPQPEWRVLDVATGGGHTALRFAPHVAQVIATDLTPTMLDAARSHIISKGAENVLFQVADAEALPFKAASFDLVTCRIAAHHFPDAFAFVQACARVLVPGGVLIVQDHVLPDNERDARYVDAFETLRDPSHNRAFAEYEWTGMFLDAGLTVTHTEQIIKRHHFGEWTARQGCSLAVVERLTVMLAQAPVNVAAWMQPHHIHTPDASFVNHHLIIVGQKI